MRDLLDADAKVQIVGTSRKHKQALQKIFSHERVQWVHYDRRYEYLDWADVIISVTDSPHYTFLADKVAEIRKETKPQLFLDLAIPRDIDAEIGRLSSCVVKDLDYIKSLATENNRKNHGEAWREIRDVAFVPVERRSGCTGLKSRIKGDRRWRIFHS